MPVDLVQLSPIRNPLGFEIYSGGSSTYDSLQIVDHRHQHSIISVVLEGEVAFNGWNIQPGEFMYHPARLPFSEISDRPGWHLWMEFSLEVVKLSNRPAKGTILDLTEYKQTFESLAQMRKPGSLHEESVHSSFFFRLLAKLDGLPDRVERKPQIELAIREMELNYSKPLSRESLAELVGFHPNAFDRSFKRSEGVPPMEYLRQIRLDAFKKLLRETDLTIEDISIRCGLTSAAYASRFFKQFTCMNPTDYRKGVKKTRVGYYIE